MVGLLHLFQHLFQNINDSNDSVWKLMVFIESDTSLLHHS